MTQDPSPGTRDAHPSKSSDPRENAAYWKSMYEDQLRRKRLLQERHNRLHAAASVLVDRKPDAFPSRVWREVAALKAELLRGEL